MSLNHIGNYESLHVVSQNLSDRYPYFPEKSEQHFSPNVHPYEIATAYGERCYSKYVDLLGVPGLSFEDRFRALSELFDLLSNPQQKYEAIRAGCIQACVNGLKTNWDEHPPTASRAIDILASCSLLEEGRKMLDLYNSLEIIVPFIKHNHYRVRESTSRTFHYISQSKDGTQMILKSPTVLRILIPAIIDDTRGDKQQPPSNPIIYHSCSALANLTSYSPGCIECLKYDICVPYLLRALQSKQYDVQFNNEKEEVESYCMVLSVLWNLSNEESGKKIILENESLPLILSTLKTHYSYPQIQFMASGSIMALSINVTVKREVYLKGGCDILAQLAHSGANNEIQKNARVAISNVSENSDARLLLCTLLCSYPDIFIEVFDFRCIKVLNDFILKTDQSAPQAMHLLHHYMFYEKSKEIVVQTLYLIDHIIQYIENFSHDNNHLVEAYEIILELLPLSVQSSLSLQKSLNQGRCQILLSNEPIITLMKDVNQLFQ